MTKIPSLRLCYNSCFSSLRGANEVSDEAIPKVARALARGNPNEIASPPEADRNDGIFGIMTQAECGISVWLRRQVEVLNKVKDHNNKDENGKNSTNKEKEILPEEDLQKSDEQVIMPAQEILELKKKCQETEIYFDKFLRLQAEFENVRKRLIREKEEFIKFAEASLILELIPIMEDFERALDAANKKEDIESLKKGIEIIVGHLKNLLSKRGLSAMESVGKPFNPDLHEALLQEENDEYPENTVLEEYQKGYFLEDKVLRHAKVKTSKKTVD